MAALIPAGTFALASPIVATATYHPGRYQWYSVYLQDGSFQGQDLNEADYYTWSDGTESVSDMYAGIARSSNNYGTTMTWVNAWLYNYDGSVPLYVYWSRFDCGLSCSWTQKMWSGWKTVQAQSHYGLMSHGIYWGCCQGYSQHTMAMYWP